MPVIILLVAAVILGGIVVVAMGRGGELARDTVDLPAAVDLRTWSDVARYRPPPALLGYHAASTEQALKIIARSVAERDAEISWLRGRLAELQPESPGRGGDVADPPDAGTPARGSWPWPLADEKVAIAGEDRVASARSQADAADVESTSTPNGATAWDDTPPAPYGATAKDDMPPPADRATGQDDASPQDAARDGRPPPDGGTAAKDLQSAESASDDPSADGKASAQEGVSAAESRAAESRAAENRPAAEDRQATEHSHAATQAEPSVQAGHYWQQAWPARRPSTDD